jgi:HEAT repeat protein
VARLVAAAALAWPAVALGQGGQAASRAVPPVDAWLFVEAWQTFRHDIDASLPGEHGSVQLAERLGDEPDWVLHDGLRLAASPTVLSFLARRAARRGDSGALPALRRALEGTRDESSRLAIERAMVVLGDDLTIRALERRLHDGSPQERHQAATLLVGAGQKAAPALETALEDPDVQTSLASASALAGLGHRRAQKLIHDLLSSANPYHRLEAAHALARAGDRRALPPLREKLRHPGVDSVQIVRSLGLAGEASDRELIVSRWTALPRGRSLELNRGLLIALGRIATRTSLPAARAIVDAVDEEADDDRGVRGDWLEAIGWASAGGARDQAGFAAGIAGSVAEPFAGETPIAHQHRSERVAALLAALAGRAARAPDRAETATAPRAALEQWLRDATPNDAGVRARRFDAAVALLARLGERLGYERYADPPVVGPVGLGSERAVDGNLLTAWIAGPMTGPLRLDLPAPTKVSALRVVNGCVDSPASYDAHARVKTLSVTVEGARPTTATLADGTPAFQRIALPGEVARRVTLEVTATWPGERAGAPACIAELRLE